MTGPDLGGNGGTPEQAPPPAQTPPSTGQAGAAASQAASQAGAAASQAAAEMEKIFRGFSMAEQFMVGGALVAILGGQFLFGSLLGGGDYVAVTLLASAELILAV